MTHPVYCFRLADSEHAFDDEGISSTTSIKQKLVESLVASEAEISSNLWENNLNSRTSDSKTFAEEFVLRRQNHIQYVLRSMQSLSQNYMSMDASKPWFCFWGMHSLRLLGHRPDKEFLRKNVLFLKSCEAPSGGYGGAPGQLPHLATTYAAIMSLVSVATTEALTSIDRVKLRTFLMASKCQNGSFSLHAGGEADIRGTYCAVTCAFITGIADEELFKDTPAWIMRCQTYEGGFGGEPNCEAHGGYTFCALASLALLRKTHLLNVPLVLDWLVHRQMKFEGGFNGRTNKLVDGCYSFWQAAAFFPLEFELTTKSTNFVRGLFDERALQNYILVSCQDQKNGGLRDKPNKVPDLYHTCYTLSGLSIAQSYVNSPSDLVGGESNRLADVHPLFNVCVEMENFAKLFFSSALQAK